MDACSRRQESRIARGPTPRAARIRGKHPALPHDFRTAPAPGAMTWQPVGLGLSRPPKTTVFEVPRRTALARTPPPPSRIGRRSPGRTASRQDSGDGFSAMLGSGSAPWSAIRAAPSGPSAGRRTAARDWRGRRRCWGRASLPWERRSRRWAGSGAAPAGVPAVSGSGSLAEAAGSASARRSSRAWAPPPPGPPTRSRASPASCSRTGPFAQGTEKPSRLPPPGRRHRHLPKSGPPAPPSAGSSRCPWPSERGPRLHPPCRTPRRRPTRTPADRQAPRRTPRRKHRPPRRHDPPLRHSRVPPRRRPPARRRPVPRPNAAAEPPDQPGPEPGSTTPTASPRPDPQAPPGLPEDLASTFGPRIRALGRRPRKPVLRALILDLCSFHDWTRPAELARWLGVDRRSLVRRHLGPMTAAGLLERRYPDAPRSPRQAYRTAPAPPPASGPSPRR